MRQALAAILFDDDDPAAAEAERTSIVRPAQPSPTARGKAATKRTADDLPTHSFRTLLADLATIVRNTCQPKLPGMPSFEKITVPPPLQRRALDLLGVPEKL